MGKKALSASGWAGLLREQASSGLTVREFCQRRSVAASTLFAWKRKLALNAKGSKHQSSAVKKRRSRRVATFVEAKMFGVEAGTRREDADACVMIELVCGHRIIVKPCVDRRLLLDVIDALESRARGGGEYKKLEMSR